MAGAGSDQTVKRFSKAKSEISIFMSVSIIFTEISFYPETSSHILFFLKTTFPNITSFMKPNYYAVAYIFVLLWRTKFLCSICLAFSISS